MKAFPLSFMVGCGFLLTDSFHRFSGEKPGELHKILICGGSPQGKIGWRSLCFALCLCVYLFIICFFIACLYVRFLITLRELFVASCINYVVQRREDYGGGYFCVLMGQLWLNLLSIGFDARQDVMKSLPSFLIYCCYCLQLFILLLSIVSNGKPVY